MKTWGVVLLVCTLANAAEVTPVQKVIQLLQGMTQKGKDEMQKEEVQFAQYKQWCEDTDGAKEKEINELADNIKRLTARIEKADATISDLTTSIEKDTAEAAGWDGELKKATEIRSGQKADYDKLNADYSESIDALERAIKVLKEQDKDTPQALVQVTQSPLIPDEVKNSLATFLAQQEEEAPEANAYEFQSGGVVQLLEKLLDKFVDERSTLQKEEANRLHAFQMAAQDLKSNIEGNNQRIAEETEQKNENIQQKADDEGQVAEDTQQKKTAETYKAEVAATCESKANDFAARLALRQEELQAIAKAIEILESPDVSGAADKHLPAVFAQLRSDSRSPSQYRAAAYLQEQAKQLNSRVLSAVAEHVAEDPFAKVKKMINDLITKLTEEANEEAEHKGWCDTELATNEQVRTEQSGRVEKLSATVDELNAEITRLGEEIVELQTTIAESTQMLAKADALRAEEKATNRQTVEDGKAALIAVAKATAVLKEFYAKAGEATALVQQPEIFDKPYQGLTGESGGIVGMLEVIETDFQRLVDETEATEAENANKHRTLTEETNTLISESKRMEEMKTADKDAKTTTLKETETDLEETQKQLDAALNYYDKLKPSCVDNGTSYEDRVAQRANEIQSLKEALEILGQL